MTKTLSAALAFSLLAAVPAAAQTAYPSKAITIVVPASPGGVPSVPAQRAADEDAA